MANTPAGVRRRSLRDDDPVDSFFDIPAAVLCATCGQADCPGCTAASETESGVVAIVPWERSGGMWTRLWATANATTQGAEAFFNDSAPARYIIREFPGQFRVISDPENGIDVNQYSIGIKQGEQILLNYINWALVRMRLDGRLEAIHKRWLESTDLMPGWARMAV